MNCQNLFGTFGTCHTWNKGNMEDAIFLLILPEYNSTSIQ